MPDLATLKEFSSATLDLPVVERLLHFESRTELVAYVDSDYNVCITRTGGQRTTTITLEQLGDSKPTCIQWHINGKALHVGTESGALYAIDAEAVRPTAAATILQAGTAMTCLGRVVNSSVCLASRYSEKTQDVDVWLSKFQLNSDSEGEEGLNISSKDLPQRLAAIDIETVLPTLGPINAHSTTSKQMPGRPAKVAAVSEHVWQLLSQSTSPDLSIDVQVNALADGSMILGLGSCFQHRLSLIPSDSHMSSYHTPIKHCGDSRTSHHAILLVVFQPLDDQVGPIMAHPKLAVFQNPFSLSGGQHTPLIFAKSSQLQGLKLLLSQCTSNLLSEWSSHSALPANFIRNIGEELGEKNEAGIQCQLYMLAMTGECSPTVAEWLKDVLQERGHKRWDTAMTSLYSSVSQILQLHISPALERCALVASQLRGLATYYANSHEFTVEPEEFTLIINAVTTAQTLTHEAMRLCSREVTLYRVFAKWLRKQIDLAGMEAGSAGAIEAAETIATSTDLPNLLEYLEGPIIESRLTALIEDQLDDSGSFSLDDVSAAIETARVSPEQKAACLSLPLQIRAVIGCLEQALGQINAWQSSTLKAPTLVDIDGGCTYSVYDMRMFVSPAQPPDILVVTNDMAVSSDITIGWIKLGNGPLFDSEYGSAQHRMTLHLEEGSEVMDVVILVEQIILALVRIDGHAHLLTVPLRDLQDGSQVLSEVDVTILHTFNTTNTFLPAQIRVTEREHKQKVLVLDALQRSWKVLDMRHGTQSRSIAAKLTSNI